MKQFSSLDLQQKTGEVQRSAFVEPVVITNHGKPRFVMVTVEEFARLKTSANEPVPAEVRGRKPVEKRGLPVDPLGRDTRDFDAFVLQIADHALSGRDRQAVAAEIAGAERRLGIGRGDARV
jgi:prevent-host-death family protein